MRALHPRCPMRTAPPSRTQQPWRPTRAAGPTKPRASELFSSPPVQTLILSKSKCTSERPDCGDRSDDAPIPVRGCFIRCTPTEIPACWLKRSPSEGKSSGDGECGEGVIPPPTLFLVFVLLLIAISRGIKLRGSSGWTRRLMKVRKRSAPVNPPRSSRRMTSCRGCSLQMYW
jgi:hypothetical protein